MPLLVLARGRRRSRSTFDSDEDEEVASQSTTTREATPLSTAPNDAKRARRRLPVEESEEEDEDEDEDDDVGMPGRREGRKLGSTSTVQSSAQRRRGLVEENESGEEDDEEIDTRSAVRSENRSGHRLESAVPSSAQRPRRMVDDDEDDDDIEEDKADEDEETGLKDNNRRPNSRTPSNGILMNRRADADGPQTKRKHQPGAIVRVKVTNFVTYTSAEFFPGPNLNMVIGPNGTGKSSLVCAICLGLGWGPQHLGRAKEVSEFIKNGYREATIEIELQRAETGPHSRENPVFTRHMKREGNKSTWMINGTASNNKQVVTLARSFSVQIDNLCQFLPQDKVVEFAQMNPMALLESTQRAVAPELLEHHTNLIKIREKQKDILSHRKHDKEELKTLENRQEGSRLEVENTRRRKEITKKLEWLEKCRPITLYDDALKKAREAKLLQKELARELKQLEQEVAPALRRVNEKEKYEKETLALKAHREKELKAGEKACDDLEKEMDKCDASLDECDALKKAEQSGISTKRQDKLKYRQVIQNLKQQIEEGQEPYDLTPINNQIRSKTAQRNEASTAVQETSQRLQDGKDRGKALNDARAELKARLEALDTEAGKQMTKLEKASHQTHKAWKWIQDNQDQFQKTVFGPPMITCSLKDPGMAKVMEPLFQENDFKFITVQCQQDFITCQRKLIQENKWSDISIRVCPTASLDQFRPPMPSETLRELGLDGWAIEFIDGPPTVIAMLCFERSLHQNGVGRREINNAQYQAIVRTGMRNFVAGGTSYRLTHRAEYGEAGKATSARPVRDPRIWAGQAVDGGLKASLQRQINENKGEAEELLQHMNELRTKGSGYLETHKKLIAELEELSQEKATRQEALVKFARLPQEKAEAEDKLKDAVEFLDGVRDRIRQLLARKDEITLEKAKLAVKYAAAVSQLRVYQQQLLEAEVMHIEALSDYQSLKARNEDIHNLLTTRRREQSHAEKLAKEKTVAARQLYAKVQKLQELANKNAEEGDSTLSDIFQEIAEKHATPEGYGPLDLEADIDTIKADLELNQGGEQRVIDEFEKREALITTLKERLAASNAKNAEMAALIRETRNLWETRLDELVGVISDQFGENFRRIGCAGSVVVHKANAPDDEVEVDLDDNEDNQNQRNPDGNGLDFANWALHISVKFREAEPLSLLDSHRQSGGERAVSTIFYLMALQSLSKAPFRVVDEINQGMDPRNERMVHGRMVDIAAGGNGESGGSQYFLVTPKLLGGLKYRPGMTVLCIVSGENMPAATAAAGGGGGESRVDFRRLVQRARELGLGNMARGGAGGAAVANGRRIDSGVAMGGSFDSDDMYGNGDGEEVGVRGHRGMVTGVGA
jgi:chromosome segregation ATPase